ncbi:MAG: UvrB/UvrC motif-containing protein, partial [Thermoanaerobaculia bacterium]
QTAGRAARNLEGRVLFYADRVTDSMRRAMSETDRRRLRQQAYNEAHGIEPRSVLKDIHSPLVTMSNLDYFSLGDRLPSKVAERSGLPLSQQIEMLEREMKSAAKRLEFEEAATLRDELRELKELQIYTD